ncbi:MAG TPA: hypothetical protein VGH85_22185 [Mycobacteriales bacterium]|jgi:hypothetical protein
MNSVSTAEVVGVARPTFLGPLVPASVGVIIWLVIVGTEGWVTGVKYSWLLVLATGLALWTALPRLHYSPTRLELTIGPWRRAVDLMDLKSIKWVPVRGAGNQGKILVSDKHGDLVPLYVGRFSKTEEWGSLLLSAAVHCNADVDRRAHSILDQRSRQRSQ